MPSALILTSGGPGAPALAEDLAAVGVEVIGAAECSNLVQAVIKTAPDLVMIYEFRPDSALFDSIALVTTTAPRPVVVFTPDPDADSIAHPPCPACTPTSLTATARPGCAR